MFFFPTTDLHQHEHLFQGRPVIEFQPHIVQADCLWIVLGRDLQKKGINTVFTHRDRLNLMNLFMRLR